MTRLVSGAIAVLAVVAAALLGVWLLGQLLQFLGVFLSGLAHILARLTWFLLLASAFGGLAYFLASANRRG